MNRLEERVAIVSGAGDLEAIGGATALRLSGEGASVVVADINLAGAQVIADKICGSGAKAYAIQLDLGNEESISALFDAVMERYGRVDILHNNAADTRVEQMLNDMAIEFMDADIWDRAFDINVRGTMLMIKHVIPLMRAQGQGSIINTSSGASLRGDFYAPAYAASKAAINSLTQYVATQYGKINIRCNAVSPGLILTGNAKKNNSEDQLKTFESHSLTPTLGLPEDIAAAVAYLASDDARFVTGQTLVVDGGYISHMPHVGDNQENFAQSPTGRSV